MTLCKVWGNVAMDKEPMSPCLAQYHSTGESSGKGKVVLVKPPFTNAIIRFFMHVHQYLLQRFSKELLR
jgi:hypothetical protein